MKAFIEIQREAIFKIQKMIKEIRSGKRDKDQIVDAPFIFNPVKDPADFFILDKNGELITMLELKINEDGVIFFNWWLNKTVVGHITIERPLKK